MKVQIPIYCPSSSSCIFFAYFMVTCCINEKQGSHSIDTVVWQGCLSGSFTWSCALLVTMMNLYWHSISFAHSHEYIYGNKSLPLYLQWHSKLPWNMQVKTPFLKQGGNGSAPGICQLLWSINILSKDLLLHWNLEEYHCICRKNVEHLCL